MHQEHQNAFTCFFYPHLAFKENKPYDGKKLYMGKNINMKTKQTNFDVDKSTGKKHLETKTGNSKCTPGEQN